jgi:hypothetical protein
MSELAQPTRRGLLRGFAALLAAPAIVRVSSLMPISPQDEIFIDLIPPPGVVGNGSCLLTVQMITREAIRLWAQNNAFIRDYRA